LDLTVINLPWPADWAEKLKILASESIRQWHLKYKSAHPQLVSLYALMMNYNINEVRQPITISRATHSDRISTFNANLFSKYSQEYADIKQTLYDSLDQCDRLLEILIPSFQDDTNIDNNCKNNEYVDLVVNIIGFP
jgi:hypothetical protein